MVAREEEMTFPLDFPGRGSERRGEQEVGEFFPPGPPASLQQAGRCRWQVAGKAGRQGAGV